jgi:hypothetical protein
MQGVFSQHLLRSITPPLSVIEGSFLHVALDVDEPWVVPFYMT